MDLNNKIEYLQRLGTKTELKDIIEKAILIRVNNNKDLISFIDSINDYGKRNSLKLSISCLLAENNFPFQFRIIHQKTINSFYILIYKVISEELYFNMLVKKEVVNSNDIHFEEVYKC